MRLSADMRLLLALGGISLALHFVGLSWPPQVVFDEVHFGKFVTAYCCTGKRFFDIHPPHAKLLIAGAARLGGYRGGFDFANIGQPYGGVPIAALRFLPALSGAMLPLLIFWLMRALNGSRAAAFLASWAVLFDNALTVQTRIIALDGILLVATFGGLLAYLWSEKAEGYRRWAWLAGAGALSGLALGAKFTGLAAPALIGLLVVADLYREKKERKRFSYFLKQFVLKAAVLAVSFSVVYLSGWALHFALLAQPGSGDAFHRPDFSGGPVSSFLRETVELHQVMFKANYGLTATHPYASPWWSWPVMQRSVFYWQGLPTGHLTRFIYFLGNPVVWWGTTALLAVALARSLISFGRGTEGPGRFQQRTGVALLGLVVALVPLMRVPRALFLYHYLTPLIFALLAGLLWVDARFPLGSLSAKGKLRYAAVLVVIVLGFGLFSPLTFGLAVPIWWRDSLFWLPTWR